MSCSKVDQTNSDFAITFEINDLPNEVLEYIFSHLSPYYDFKNVMIVCKRWRKIIQGVKYQIESHFHQAIEEGKLRWQALPSEAGPSITERYAHSACYYDRSMFVFGGCTSTSTTFNDLWQLDLTTCEWSRPLASGAYPSPKACATLVQYEKNLLLFGGWSHRTPYTFHQASKFFNQLHSFCPETSRWSQIVTPVSPCGKAGHGATVMGDSMVIFGGYHAHNTSSNQIWVFDIMENSWTEKGIAGNIMPPARYGHTQVLVDRTHILVVGGCGGPNTQLSDAWLLNTTHEPWFWSRIDIVNLQNAAHQLWCHPACPVGNKIVVLSKNTRMNRAGLQQASRGGSQSESSQISANSAKINQDHRSCSFSNRAHFKRTHPETSESSSQESSSDTDDAMPCTNRSPRGKVTSRPSTGSKCVSGSSSGGEPSDALTRATPPSPRAGMPSVRPNASKNRQKQLETLKWYENKIKQMGPPNNPAPQDVSAEPFASIQTTNPMYVHVLDVSEVLTEAKAVWKPVHQSDSIEIPDETIFYSLVEGRGELILFGGIQMDLNSMQKDFGNNSHQQASKSVHFLRAPTVLR